MRQIASLLLAVALFATSVPAEANEDREAVFAEITRAAVTDFIAPAYDRLAAETELMGEATDALCAAPGEDTLGRARSQFRQLVVTWSGIALIRFGPVSSEHRFERIWFFPDRRGLALRQVQGLIARADPESIAAEGFAGKSVAVQGMPALEFALFGTGSEVLGDAGESGVFRCRFAAQISSNLIQIARTLADDWTQGGAFAGVILAPGPDNALYRSHEEVVRALIGAMTTELQFVRDAKIRAVLGESAGEARPKSAAFWRSGQALASIRANVDAVLGLYEAAGFDAALGAQHRWLSGSIRFEFANTVSALDRITMPLGEAVADPDLWPILDYATVTLRGALTAIATHYAEGAGITMGFNALDGD